jgi:hypothetical protein
MRSFEGTAQVDADPQRVWDAQLVLADWASWDPNIVRTEGRLAAEGEVTLYTTRPGEQKVRPFKLRVVEWDPPHRLVLKGGIPFGLFTGTQVHESTAHGGGTRFVIREEFTGPLARIFKIPDLQRGFQAFADGLRRAAMASDRD